MYMFDSFGDVLIMEDGTKADVTPLKDDRGALISLALLAVLSLALIFHSLLFA